MRRFLATLVFAAAAAAGIHAQAPTPGTWDLRPSRDGAHLRLQLREADSSWGSRIELTRLSGLSGEQLAGAGPVRFSIRRDAGTFVFDGVSRAGVAAGTYTFDPNAAYLTELGRRGMQRPTLEEQRTLARQDVSLEFIDELRRTTPITLSGLIKAANHGVSAGYLRELRALGYQRLGLEDLVRLRNHGIDGDYIRDLAALGYQPLPLDELVRLRNHGVDPDYISALTAIGYGKLSLEQLVTLRSHGVDPDYVRELSSLGYSRLTIESLQRLRSHGIDPDYIRDMRQLGYTRLSIDELAALRAHGIEPREVSRENARAGRRLAIEQLTSRASRGWR